MKETFQKMLWCGSQCTAFNKSIIIIIIIRTEIPAFWLWYQEENKILNLCFHNYPAEVSLGLKMALQMKWMI